MEIGETVALLVTKYHERPQIGRVKSVDEERQKVVIEWYDGGWTTKWKLYKYKSGRKFEIWTEEVNSKDIIKRNIKLTPSNRLPSNLVKELKNLY